MYEVYEKIGTHFSHTRHNPWPKVEYFLKSLEPGTLVADIDKMIIIVIIIHWIILKVVEMGNI